MMTHQESLPIRLQRVTARVTRACQAGGRCVTDVAVVCVTKAARIEDVAAVVRQGWYLLGENRVQEAPRKQDELAGLLSAEEMRRIQWHMIGHLQTNKVAPALRWAAMIQSVDSLRLAARIDQCARRRGTPVACLAQINISQETAKFGAGWDDAVTLIAGLQTFEYITCAGVMGIAPLSAHAEASRPYFAQLRRLWEDINQRQAAQGKPALPVLSMGMSNDFEVAIEEGATMVRVGTAIFGG